MNKRSVDIESAANLGKIVKAGTKKAPIKKAAPKKPAGKPPVKKAAEPAAKSESTPKPQPTPNKVANSGKAYQPTLPGMRNTKQFKEPNGK